MALAPISHYTGRHSNLVGTLAHSENSVLASATGFNTYGSSAPVRYGLPGLVSPVYHGTLLGRRRIVLENQGLSAIAFFEATAFIMLLVLFFLLRRDHPTRYSRVLDSPAGLRLHPNRWSS